MASSNSRIGQDRGRPVRAGSNGKGSTSATLHWSGTLRRSVLVAQAARSQQGATWPDRRTSDTLRTCRSPAAHHALNALKRALKSSTG